MSFLNNFEKKIENGVQAIFSKIGKNELAPADFVAMLQKEMDEKALHITQERTVAPNKVTVHLSSADYDTIEEWGAVSFADELANNLSHYANAQNYVLSGPIRVHFKEDVDLEKGDIRIISESVRGTIQDDKNVINSPNRVPYLEIGGDKYPLNKEIIVIGRGSDCDIVLDDSGISRKHCEIRYTDKGTIIADLGSTNGIYVENEKVPAASLVDGNEILIGRTNIYYREING